MSWIHAASISMVYSWYLDYTDKTINQHCRSVTFALDERRSQTTYFIHRYAYCYRYKSVTAEIMRYSGMEDYIISFDILPFLRLKPPDQVLCSSEIKAHRYQNNYRSQSIHLKSTYAASNQISR